jgi:hypothetical protein
LEEKYSSSQKISINSPLLRGEMPAEPRASRCWPLRKQARDCTQPYKGFALQAVHLMSSGTGPFVGKFMANRVLKS